MRTIDRRHFLRENPYRVLEREKREREREQRDRERQQNMEGRRDVPCGDIARRRNTTGDVSYLSESPRNQRL
jgi:hypothetical protein